MAPCVQPWLHVQPVLAACLPPCPPAVAVAPRCRRHLGLRPAVGGDLAVAVPAGTVSAEPQQESGDEGVGGAGSLHHHPCQGTAWQRVGTATHTAATGNARGSRRAPTGDVGGLQQVQLQEGGLGEQRRVGIVRGGPAPQLLPGVTAVEAGSVGRGPCLLRGGGKAAVRQGGDAQRAVAGICRDGGCGVGGDSPQSPAACTLPTEGSPVVRGGGLAYLRGEAAGR